LREIVGRARRIVCCGVGFQGGSFYELLDAGGDYPIVGRSIYNAADPIAACRAILVRRRRDMHTDNGLGLETE